MFYAIRKYPNILKILTKHCFERIIASKNNISTIRMKYAPSTMTNRAKKYSIFAVADTITADLSPRNLFHQQWSNKVSEWAGKKATLAVYWKSEGAETATLTEHLDNSEEPESPVCVQTGVLQTREWVLHIFSAYTSPAMLLAGGFLGVEFLPELHKPLCWRAEKTLWPSSRGATSTCNYVRHGVPLSKALCRDIGHQSFYLPRKEWFLQSSDQKLGLCCGTVS